MLQGVIFDMDGVIVDSHPAHLRAWRAFFESRGREVSDEQLLVVLEGRKREEILQHFFRDLSPDEVKCYGEHKDALFRESFAEVQVIAGVCDLLDELHASGIPAAVASSGSRKRVEFTLEQLNLRPHFRVVVTGSDVTKGKPDPALFHLAAIGLGVEPAGIVVCEDSIAGVAAAKSAGMKCLGIASAGRQSILLAAGADYAVPDFTSVRAPNLKNLFAAVAGAG